MDGDTTAKAAGNSGDVIWYRATPLRVVSVVLIVMSIYYVLRPGPMGFGVIVSFYAFPIALLLLGMDHLLRLFTKRQTYMIMAELVILSILAVIYFLNRH